MSHQDALTPNDTTDLSTSVSLRIRGSGDMADQIRRHPWENTSLGPIAAWSNELTTAVNMMISSRLIACLVWGARRVLLYNDLYKPLLGAKHPCLGESFLDVWAEIHDQPHLLIAEPWNREEANLVERVPFRLLFNGNFQERICSLTNNPVWEGTVRGPEIVGVAQTIIDHTDAAIAESNLKASNLQLQQSQSGQIKAMQALSASERRFQALVAAGSDAVYRMSADWSEMRQLERRDSQQPFLAETFTGNRNWLAEYIYPGDQETVRRAIQSAIHNKSVFELEHRVIREDGGVGWAHSRAVPLLDARGEVQEWFGMAADVSQKKASEAALIQSEKLAAVGRLASTIAHELNNPLDAVRNMIWLIKSEGALPQSVYDYLDLADEELTRVFHLAKQSLSFSRTATSSQELDIGELVEGVLAVFGPRMRNKSVAVLKKIDYQSSLVGVEADLRQIVTNLISNSLDALPTSGAKLWVRVRSGSRKAQRGTRLTIADNGIGIPEGDRGQVFEPFFSQKKELGTGLGLWITKEIVEKHGGAVRLRSSSVLGFSWTVLSVFLPEGK